MHPGADRTPVTLLTGFLGSGKTTLLNAALREARAPIGVVVNEFGPIGIDHDLVEAADEDVVLLAGGCACCAVRSDVGEALVRLGRMREASGAAPLARVVIETSGLADPTPLEQLFVMPGAVAARHRLDRVVTTVDACLGAGTAADDGVWARQVALADTLVVTKTDLADPSAQQALATALDAVNPHARRCDRRDGAAALAGADAPAVRLRECAPAYAPVHDDRIVAHTVRLREPMDAAVLSDWLDALVACYGDRLLRVKGLVAIAGESRPLVVHAVQHLVAPPRLLDAWPAGDRHTRLAFIARGLERNDLASGYAGPEVPEWL